MNSGSRPSPTTGQHTTSLRPTLQSPETSDPCLLAQLHKKRAAVVWLSLLERCEQGAEGSTYHGSKCVCAVQEGTVFGIENSRNSAVWDTPGVKALSKFKGVLTLSCHNGACSQNIRFPLSFFFSKCRCTVFCTDVQILQCLASQAAQFLQIPVFFEKKRLRRSKRTLAVYFSVSLDVFFAMHTAKSDVQRDVFALVKISNSYFAMLRICALSVHFHTGSASFALPEKYVSAVQTIAMLGSFSTASWSIVFYLNCDTMQCKTERMFWVSRYQGSVDQDRHQLPPPSRRGIDLRSQSFARVLDDCAT